mmetsp:Transcript_2873/g.3631  ORF Transcript_2873/g.3631 Transcript_2873/m.3631 type:complete len:125 (-) Transcript_2873:107-481(-)
MYDKNSLEHNIFRTLRIGTRAEPDSKSCPYPEWGDAAGTQEVLAVLALSSLFDKCPVWLNTQIYVVQTHNPLAQQCMHPTDGDNNQTAILCTKAIGATIPPTCWPPILLPPSAHKVAALKIAKA